MGIGGVRIIYKNLRAVIFVGDTDINPLHSARRTFAASKNFCHFCSIQSESCTDQEGFGHIVGIESACQWWEQISFIYFDMVALMSGGDYRGIVHIFYLLSCS